MALGCEMVQECCDLGFPNSRRMALTGKVNKTLDQARSQGRRSPKRLDAMVPTAIVLHGPTSAGKSSIAKALQASSSVPAFHVSLDAFVTMSNRSDMRSDEEREQAYHIHCENLRSTLERLVYTQFDIIVDLVLRDETEIEATLRALASRPTYVIGISAPLHVLEEREHGRE